MFSSLFGAKKDVLEVAEAALKARDWKYSRMNERTILTGCRAGAASLLIVIKNEPGKRALLVMGNAIVGNTDPLASLSAGSLPLLRVHSGAGHSAQQVAKACDHLLRRNYEFAVGAFERDPSDGEIRFRIGLPYRDGMPTEEQIEWCIASTLDAMSNLLREFGDITKPSQGMEI